MSDFIVRENVNSNKSGIKYWNAIVAPFQQENWFLRLWWVFLLLCIPAFGLVLLRGWRVEMVRRMGAGEEDILPELKGLVNFLIDGFILWFMTFIYWIPLVIVMAIVGLKQYIVVLDIIWWSIERFILGNEVQAFGVMIGQGVLALMFELSLPLIYFTFMGPIYRAGMIRYALTGKISSFFLLHKNVSLILRHPYGFISIYLLEQINVIIVLILIGIVGGFLAGIGIGLLTPVFFITMHYWTTGNLFGQLAHKVVNITSSIGRIC